MKTIIALVALLCTVCAIAADVEKGSVAAYVLKKSKSVW